MQKSEPSVYTVCLEWYDRVKAKQAGPSSNQTHDHSTGTNNLDNYPDGNKTANLSIEEKPGCKPCQIEKLNVRTFNIVKNVYLDYPANSQNNMPQGDIGQDGVYDEINVGHNKFTNNSPFIVNSGCISEGVNKDKELSINEDTNITELSISEVTKVTELSISEVTANQSSKQGVKFGCTTLRKLSPRNIFIICLILFVVFGLFGYMTVELAKLGGRQTEEDIQKFIKPTKNQTTFIGFTAWKQENQTFTDEEDAALIYFDQVMTNKGIDTGPNYTLSNFTCPVSGVYYISVTTASDSDTFYNVCLRSEMVFSWESNHYLLSWNTNSVVFKCDEGEEFWIEGNLHGLEVPKTLLTLMNIDSGCTPLVAFCATQTAVITATSTARFTFDKIIYTSDVTTEYSNEQTDRYTCPISGIYFVTVTIRNAFLVSLWKRAEVIMDCTGGLSKRNSATNSAVFYCHKDEWLSLFCHFCLWHDENDYVAQSLFSVMLVHPTDPQQSSCKQENSNFIAFYGWKDKSETYRQGDLILFQHSSLNDGGAYNKQTGSFICPIHGVYYVFLTLSRCFHDAVDIALIKEGQTLFVIDNFYYIDSNGGNVQLSSSVLTECFVEEEIKVVANGPSALCGDKRYNTFSIFIVYQQ